MAKRVFFSFHYQDVIDFRANVVRNHWVTKKDSEAAGFFDASIWEDAKKESDDALKRLINKELKNTSVTTVLTGTETHARKWVRYETFKSIERGNHVIAVHINKISCKKKLTKSLGPDPFKHLGLYFKDGKAHPIYRATLTGKWYYFNLVPAWTTSVAKNFDKKSVPLSQWYSTYDWIAHDGYNNFSKWVTK